MSDKTSPIYLITKFTKLCKQEGIRYASKKAFCFIKSKIGMIDPIYKRRVELSDQIDTLLNSIVAYGPFKGLRLSREKWWGTAERANMLFGLYEQEILNSLTKIPATHRTFVDLGAADGYYGVGVLINNLFDKSYCFEISNAGRNVIRQNAQQNGMLNRISIYGTAEKDFYKYLPAKQLSKSVLLVDIEGGEFDLFDRRLFEIFKDSILILELHDHFFEDGHEKLRRLKRDASEFFEITELTTTSRDLSKFLELKEFNDTDRWLICSEGRRALPHWYRLDPKDPRPAPPRP